MTPTVLATSRPRAGRRFEPTHELALADDAVQACRMLPGAHRGLLIIAEMAGPIGIPDLTALVGDLDRLDRRLALDVPPLLHEVDAAVAAVAHPRRAQSPEAMAAALGWPAGTVLRRVPYLLRAGALERRSPTTYVRPLDIRPVGRIYAVEAKVRDRTAALQQARTYSVWADSYVLVMGPLTDESLRRLREDVDHDQGGLMVAGRMLRRPVRRNIPPSRRLWAAEHMVAALRGLDYQPSVAP
jgi:hypothetical protein